MDFALDDDQRSIQHLTRRILTDLVTEDALKAADRAGRWYDSAVWRALAEAGLLGVGIGEAQGGIGFGPTELVTVGREIGRAVAPVPWLTACCGAAPVLATSSSPVAHAALDALLAGIGLVTVAIEEPGNHDPAAPMTRLEGATLTGTKTAVLAGTLASHAVVTASGPGGPTLALVALDAPGVHAAAERATDGAPLAQLRLDGAPAVPLDGSVVALIERLRLGICAETLGVCERAVEVTAAYTQTRHQFGMPIGMFQAVKQRIADAYIDTASLEVTALRAASVFGTPEAAHAVRVAAFWAAEAGHRVTVAAQHLHGGMGFDRDYVIHRYFLRAKRLELTLGAAGATLAELGDALAASEGP